MRMLSGVLELAGLLSIGYGLWQYEPWIAFVVCGTLVMIGGILVDLMVK